MTFIKRLRLLLLNITIPAGKFIAKFHRPEMLINSSDFVDLKLSLKMGDVLMSKVNWELSNLFIPGPFKHCAVYYDGWVYESTTKGVRQVLLEEWCFKKDSIAVARLKKPIEWPEFQEGLKFLHSEQGDPYDYSFSWDTSKAWYCSKYVYRFLLACRPEFKSEFTLRETFGEMTIKPSDYYLADKVFDRIISRNVGK